MKKNNKIISLIIVCFAITFMNGQGPSLGEGRSIGLAPDFVAEKVADIVVTPRGSKWLVLRQDAHIPPGAIFDEHRDAFYLGKDDRMEIQRREEDNLGFTHYRYHSL